MDTIVRLVLRRHRLFQEDITAPLDPHNSQSAQLVTTAPKAQSIHCSALEVASHSKEKQFAHSVTLDITAQPVPLSKQSALAETIAHKAPALLHRVGPGITVQKDHQKKRYVQTEPTHLVPPSNAKFVRRVISVLLEVKHLSCVPLGPIARQGVPLVQHVLRAITALRAQRCQFSALPAHSAPSHRNSAQHALQDITARPRP